MPARPVNEITTTDEVASALRDLRLLNTDSARAVFAICLDGQRLILSVTNDELDELIGHLAAEANHEPNRRRQQRLDTAFDALSDAQAAAGGLTRWPYLKRTWPGYSGGAPHACPSMPCTRSASNATSRRD